jgi:hypothetical protein
MGWPGDRVGVPLEVCRRGRSGLHRAEVVGNTHPGKPAGQCHRKQTASHEVRVKRWCKRPPAIRVTGSARQTPPGARSNSARLRAARPSARVDRWRAPATVLVDGWPPPGLPQGTRAQNPAYRPARPHPQARRSRSRPSWRSAGRRSVSGGDSARRAKRRNSSTRHERTRRSSSLHAAPNNDAGWVTQGELRTRRAPFSSLC